MPVQVDYRATAKALRALDPALKKQIGKEFKVEAEKVALEARAHAASFSTTIPSAIRALGGLTAGLRVRNDPPIAVLNERRSGRWRHPVFGRDVWVDQVARPSARPAVAAHREALREAGLLAVGRAVKETGF